MKNLCPWPIADLLPHAGPAILIDSVLNWTDEAVEVSLKIAPGVRFFVAGRGVPVHVGLEYMAQACGAYAGLLAKEGNGAVKIGFLLGTRDFESSIAWFPPDASLVIEAKKVFQQDNMGSFVCRILCNGIESATAQLTVYQPDDPASILTPKDNER